MQENMTMKMRVKGRTFHIACVGEENDEHMNEDRGIQPSEQRESLPHIEQCAPMRREAPIIQKNSLVPVKTEVVMLRSFVI